MELFKNKILTDTNGTEQIVDSDTAQIIYEGLIASGYIKKGILTEKYYEDKKSGTVEFAEEVQDCTASVISILDSVYDINAIQFENARGIM